MQPCGGRVVVEDLPEVTAPKVQVLQELELVTLTPAMRAERSLRTEKGALTVRVGDNVAAQLGLQAGDLVFQINNTPIASAQDAKSTLDSLAGRGWIRMWFERSGRQMYADFRIR